MTGELLEQLDLAKRELEDGRGLEALISVVGVVRKILLLMPPAALSDVQRLELKEGDVLVVTMPNGTPPEATDNVRDWLAKTLPDTTSLVKTAEVKLQVVDPETLEPFERPRWAR